MRKLCFFVPALGRVNTQNRDGSEVRFANVARRWAQQGHQFDILLPQRELPLLEAEGVVARYHVLAEPIASEADSALNVAAVYAIRLLQARTRLPAASPDLIYAPSDFFFDLLPAVWMKRRHPEARLVVCLFLVAPHPFHGYEEVYTGKLRVPSFRSVAYYLLQRWGLGIMRRHADLVLVLNPLDKEVLEPLLGAAKVGVVSMGVDTQSIAQVRATTPRTYDALYLGRLHPQKGIGDLIRIWRLVCRERPQAKLGIIAGGGRDQFRRLEQDIATQGLAHNVEVLGFKDGAEKFALLKAARCLVMPSHYESFGMVAVEAMACGLPVVAYDLPPFRALFPQGMRRTPLGDMASFSQEVLRLLNHEDERSYLKLEALATAQRYDWDTVAHHEMSLLQGLFGEAA